MQVVTRKDLKSHFPKRRVVAGIVDVRRRCVGASVEPDAREEHEAEEVIHEGRAWDDFDRGASRVSCGWSLNS